MATVIETYKREDGHEIAVYESGSQYDLTAGRLIGGPPQTRYNAETAQIAVDRRRELKQEAVMRGAARALEKTGEWEKPNDYDVIEAISEAVTYKALDPKNAKQVDAARYITAEGGYAESQPSSTVPSSNYVGDFIEIARVIAQVTRDVLQVQASQIHLHDVIDGDARD